MANIFYDSKHDDFVRRQNLYDGAIYVYSPTSVARELCEFTQEFCKKHFAPHFPPNAHEGFEVDQYVEVLKKLKPAYIHHEKCKQLLSRFLVDLGCDANDTYFDVPRLRTACPHDYLTSGMAYAFKPHRDSWYSTPMCQLNWWMPIFRATEDNCMAFHLKYWEKPVRNSSSGFNYQEWNEHGRKQAHSQGKKDTRIQSEAIEEIDLDPQIRIVCEPGSIIVFSAAQLHSTVPNSTQETRISIDFRTVNLIDMKSKQGAPNYDGESTGTTAGDYLRCSQFTKLPMELIDEYKNILPAPAFPNNFQPANQGAKQ